MSAYTRRPERLIGKLNAVPNGATETSAGDAGGVVVIWHDFYEICLDLFNGYAHCCRIVCRNVVEGIATGK